MVFLSSTINGYEGTGRSLSLKLLEQLRQQSAVLSTATKAMTSTNSRTLSELELDEPIRYGVGDTVESWLNNLLCLDYHQDPSKSKYDYLLHRSFRCVCFLVNSFVVHVHLLIPVHCIVSIVIHYFPSMNPRNNSFGI